MAVVAEAATGSRASGTVTFACAADGMEAIRAAAASALRQIDAAVVRGDTSSEGWGVGAR
jgi:hypothetical protein